MSCFGLCERGGRGGIAYFADSAGPAGTVKDCVVLRNYSANAGGGIWGSNVVFERCSITDNTAFRLGGGVHTSMTATIRDSIIARNTVTSDGGAGGGIFVSALMLVESCTIVDNYADSGGGVGFFPDPLATISNSILWGNRSGAPANGDQIWATNFGSTFGPFVRYGDVEGGPAGIKGRPAFSFILISLLDVDPVFVNRMAGDYRLAAGSPLIDVGDPEIVPVLNEGDFENQPRTNGPIDMGADEHFGGLALSLLIPGRAGEQNEIEASGARSGESVFFFAGRAPGTLPLPVPACPGLELGIGNGHLLGVQVATDDGRASYASFAPASSAGTSILVPAVSFDPALASAGCLLSNLVRFLFADTWSPS